MAEERDSDRLVPGSLSQQNTVNKLIMFSGNKVLDAIINSKKRSNGHSNHNTAGGYFAGGYYHMLGIVLALNILMFVHYFVCSIRASKLYYQKTK